MPDGVTITSASVPDPASIAENRAAIEIDTTIYSLNAVLRASYKFTDQAYFFIAHREDARDRVVVTLTLNNSASSIRVLVGNFCNELLDQQVRESLAREFGDIRTLIVAQAFSEGNLLDPKRDDGNCEEDPRATLQRR